MPNRKQVHPHNKMQYENAVSFNIRNVEEYYIYSICSMAMIIYFVNYRVGTQFTFGFDITFFRQKSKITLLTLYRY